MPLPAAGGPGGGARTRSIATLFDAGWVLEQAAPAAVVAIEGTRWNAYREPTAVATAAQQGSAGCLAKPRGAHLSMRAFERRVSTLSAALLHQARDEPQGAAWRQEVEDYLNICHRAPADPLAEPHELPRYLQGVAQQFADLTAIAQRKAADYPANKDAMQRSVDHTNQAFGFCVLVHRLRRIESQIRGFQEELARLAAQASVLPKREYDDTREPLLADFVPTDVDVRLASFLSVVHEVHEVHGPAEAAGDGAGAAAQGVGGGVVVSLFSRVRALLDAAAGAVRGHSNGLPVDLVKRSKDALAAAQEALRDLEADADTRRARIAEMQRALRHRRADALYLQRYAVHEQLQALLSRLGSQGIPLETGLVYAPDEKTGWQVREGIVEEELVKKYKALRATDRELAEELGRVTAGADDDGRPSHTQYLDDEMRSVAARYDNLQPVLFAALKLGAVLSNGVSGIDAAARVRCGEGEASRLEVFDGLDLDPHREIVIKRLGSLIARFVAEKADLQRADPKHESHYKAQIASLRTAFQDLRAYAQLVTDVSPSRLFFGVREARSAARAASGGAMPAGASAFETACATRQRAANCIAEGEALLKAADDAAAASSRRGPMTLFRRV